MPIDTRNEDRITESTGNVFTDLGFDDAEAQVLALRADLMALLAKQIKARRMTQVAAAKVLGVSQARVSDLTRGKADKFSLDMLVPSAAKLGKPARIEPVTLRPPSRKQSRSEARRVRKERVSTCESRLLPNPSKKTTGKNQNNQ